MMVGVLNPAKPLIGIVGIIAIGVFVAFGIVLALSFVGTAKIVVGFLGLTLLLPVFFVRDARAYGLFLLILSIPIDISIQLSKWIVGPQDLVDEFGQPPTGTLGISIYFTDAILVAMMLPWLVDICLRKRKIYFPKYMYVYVIYLAWALFIALLEAPSLYLAVFEGMRQIMYLAFVVYIANNIVSHTQFRSLRF